MGWRDPSQWVGAHGLEDPRREVADHVRAVRHSDGDSGELGYHSGLMPPHLWSRMEVRLRIRTEDASRLSSVLTPASFSF